MPFYGQFRTELIASSNLRLEGLDEKRSFKGRRESTVHSSDIHLVAAI